MQRYELNRRDLPLQDMPAHLVIISPYFCASLPEERTRWANGTGHKLKTIVATAEDGRTITAQAIKIAELTGYSVAYIRNCARDGRMAGEWNIRYSGELVENANRNHR